ncbi:Conserved_hypothetical protein [Hexamita inflata]|uniref:Uncharacterized protein n=1 Tax=Hexamita inflata TaxID=28002 RepID=A0AA86PXQ0_9EUKA|nr:Conserved hypothetical protein [Hexamita inflata]
MQSDQQSKSPQELVNSMHWAKLLSELPQLTAFEQKQLVADPVKQQKEYDEEVIFDVKQKQKPSELDQKLSKFMTYKREKHNQMITQMIEEAKRHRKYNFSFTSIPIKKYIQLLEEEEPQAPLILDVIPNTESLSVGQLTQYTPKETIETPGLQKVVEYVERPILESLVIAYDDIGEKIDTPMRKKHQSLYTELNQKYKRVKSQPAPKHLTDLQHYLQHDIIPDSDDEGYSYESIESESEPEFSSEDQQESVKRASQLFAQFAVNLELSAPKTKKPLDEDYNASESVQNLKPKPKPKQEAREPVKIPKPTPVPEPINTNSLWFKLQQNRQQTKEVQIKEENQTVSKGPTIKLMKNFNQKHKTQIEQFMRQTGIEGNTEYFRNMAQSCFLEYTQQMEMTVFKFQKKYFAFNIFGRNFQSHASNSVYYYNLMCPDYLSSAENYFEVIGLILQNFIKDQTHQILVFGPQCCTYYKEKNIDTVLNQDLVYKIQMVEEIKNNIQDTKTILDKIFV